MSLFKIGVASVIEAFFTLRKLSDRDDLGLFTIRPEAQEKITIRDSSPYHIIPGFTVLAVVIRKYSDSERVFHHLFYLARFEFLEVDQGVYKV